MSSSNCCFLTLFFFFLQETGKVVCYSLLFKNFPQFIVIYTAKDFSIVNEAEYFWNSLAFSMIQQMSAIWSLVPLPYLNPAWTSGSSQVMYCQSLSWRILSMTVLVCNSLNTLWHCPSLGLEWKLTFSIPVATAEFSKEAVLEFGASLTGSTRVSSSLVSFCIHVELWNC